MIYVISEDHLQFLRMASKHKFLKPEFLAYILNDYPVGIFMVIKVKKENL